MFFNKRNILWLLPTCLVFISYVCAYPDRYGEKRESGKYPRAVSVEDKEHPHKQIRADSFSASEEETTTVKEVKEKKSKREREHVREKESEHERERESSKESKDSKDSDDSDSGEDNKIKSTQGIRAGEFDPEDSGKLHGRDADADSEGNGPRHGDAVFRSAARRNSAIRSTKSIRPKD